MAAPLTLGTAGHIDHGKTALIRVLTGIDTDRLPEEQARGISIELGYARLVLPSGRQLSVIDVPGHERFVRTMVAGATGIDLYLMTIAADDGVMPQTREHAAVLRALDVQAGVVAVTKSDLTDPDLAMLEATELLPGAEAIAVSAQTGAGIDELRAALDRVTAAVPSRAERAGASRLHIDRVFTIRGAGTVVTGTLWSGTIAHGDELQLLPSGTRARVRAVQVHDASVDAAAAGQRVAVNLTGIARSDVARGDVLTATDADLHATYLIDAELRLDKREPPPRVQVHHGTRESPARLAWLGGDFWQLRLEHPLIPARDDRLVIRQIAPPDTLGGGRILDPNPRKHGPSRTLLTTLERLPQGKTPESGGAAAQPRREGLRERAFPARLSDSANTLEQRLKNAHLEPPPNAELDAADLAELRNAGRAVRVGKALHYHADALAEIQERIVATAVQHGGSITLAQLRDELNTSRKFAQALLEHLDSERVTIRRGDVHVLRAHVRS
jgi:selenocysteine-specific elongation factor